ETLVNYRPKALWPKRVLKYADAAVQTRRILTGLEQHGFVARDPHEDDRDSLIDDASQKALERFDETMRDLALVRYQEVERGLEPLLTQFTVEETVRRIGEAGLLTWPKGLNKAKVLSTLTQKLAPDFGSWLAKCPALEDVARLNRETANYLRERGVLEDVAAALELRQSFVASLLTQAAETLGAARKTF